MRIRHLRIRVSTVSGPFGVDIPFSNGLVILRAENSMGKSTCIKAIFTALGLEALLTTSQSELPVPQALKSVLKTDDGAEIQVLGSEIFLEIENNQSESIVINRTIKGDRSSNLISVTQGAALSNPNGSYRTNDYFVSRPRAAVSGSGFHRFLSDFIGWELPEVHNYDGGVTPLYLQFLFPYCIVEQTRGWGSLEPPLPVRFRICDAHKRAVEFLLNLDAHRNAAKRQELKERTCAVELQWKTVVAQVEAAVRDINGTVERLPASPVMEWPPGVPPKILVLDEDQWADAQDYLDVLRRKYHDICAQRVPAVSEVLQVTQLELDQALSTLRSKEGTLARLLDFIADEECEVTATQLRLQKVEEDLQKHKDTRVLVNLGSSISENISRHLCPTCHQDIVDSLTPLAEGQNVMSLEENISFLEEQHAAYQAVLRKSTNALQSRQLHKQRLQDEVRELRASIRSKKEELISDARMPSQEAVRQKIQMGSEITLLDKVINVVSIQLNKFEDLTEAWRHIKAEWADLPKDDVSELDRGKIDQWATLLRDQLKVYDFKSVEPEQISISPYTYRTEHGGFDLPSNISASDFIRTIWAYLTGLLEMGRFYPVNHPGFIIFDEPRQQSAKELSFQNLLHRMVETKRHEQQAIFATSEKLETLKTMLGEAPHTMLNFEGHILQPLGHRS